MGKRPVAAAVPAAVILGAPANAPGRTCYPTPNGLNDLPHGNDCTLGVDISEFAGQGTPSDDWQDTDTKYVRDNLIHEFAKTDGLTDSVTLFRANNVIALASDPDCDFYDCSVQITMKGGPTNAVEPASWG